ncbi:unnamed protein product [Protopolystoma xenopodis]|uniref:Uncharacterized protein n=1 Tax=Protopolystoma xenopodis TaxID=117903 RepID=A0A448XP25_9PLAT|nr:unnamed protein product [Protopolystoma xenopodis]
MTSVGHGRVSTKASSTSPSIEARLTRYLQVCLRARPHYAQLQADGNAEWIEWIGWIEWIEWIGWIEWTDLSVDGNTKCLQSVDKLETGRRMWSQTKVPKGGQEYARRRGAVNERPTELKNKLPAELESGRTTDQIDNRPTEELIIRMDDRRTDLPNQLQTNKSSP